MASKGIRFKVWRAATKKGFPGDFYFHTILGNNKTTQPSEGYAEQREAHDTIEAQWFDTAVAQHHPGLIGIMLSPRAAAVKSFCSQFPIPYTHDSLTRAPKVEPGPVKNTPGITTLPAKRPAVKRVAALESPTNYGKGSRTLPSVG